MFTRNRSIGGKTVYVIKPVGGCRCREECEITRGKAARIPIYALRDDM